MKNTHLISIILFVTALFPFQLFAQETDVFRQEGIASWYGREFEGRPTASGEIFDASKLTAAHPNLPFGTMLVVTNLHNKKSVTVRVNDRGPFVPARIVDVSRAAAEQLDMIVTGTAPVKIESVERLSIRSGASPVVGAQVTPQAPSPQPISTPVVTAPILTHQPVLPQVNITVSLPGVISPQVVSNPALVSPPVSDSTVANQPVSNQSVSGSAPALNPEVVLPSYTPVTQPVSSVSGMYSASTAPVVSTAPVPVRLIPSINIDAGKNYRLQVGSFRVARHAVDAFDRLKNAGLSPAYERFTDSGNSDFYRVVLAGVRGSDVMSVSEKIGAAGFREALIREEN